LREAEEYTLGLPQFEFIRRAIMGEEEGGEIEQGCGEEGAGKVFDGVGF